MSLSLTEKKILLFLSDVGWKTFLAWTIIWAIYVPDSNFVIWNFILFVVCAITNHVFKQKWQNKTS